MGAGDMLRSDTLRPETLFKDVESPMTPDLFEQVVL
jgi:hypothetical protein